MSRNAVAEKIDRTYTKDGIWVVPSETLKEAGLLRAAMVELDTLSERIEELNQRVDHELADERARLEEAADKMDEFNHHMMSQLRYVRNTAKSLITIIDKFTEE